MANLKSIAWLLVKNEGLGGTWVRGSSVPELVKRIIKEGFGKDVRQGRFLVYQGVVDESATEEELKKLQTFWYVSDFGGLYSCDDLTEEDEALVKRLFKGWITHDFVPLPEPKKKVKGAAG